MILIGKPLLLVVLLTIEGIQFLKNARIIIIPLILSSIYILCKVNLNAKIKSIFIGITIERFNYIHYSETSFNQKGIIDSNYDQVLPPSEEAKDGFEKAIYSYNLIASTRTVIIFKGA